MDIGSILILLAITILVVGFVARPLVEKRGFTVTDVDRQTSTLQAERDQILTILQELDMDHAMGKVEDEDYQSQRSDLVSRGAAVLKELDLIAANGSHGKDGIDRTEIATWKLEQEIEQAVSRLRSEVEESDAGFCSQCGSELVSGDRFCSHCGAVVGMREGQ